jgi:hypothetical protein
MSEYNYSFELNSLDHLILINKLKDDISLTTAFMDDSIAYIIENIDIIKEIQEIRYVNKFFLNGSYRYKYIFESESDMLLFKLKYNI